MGFRELIQRGRQIEISRTMGIIVVAVVILLVLASGYLIYGPTTPSQAQIQAAQTDTSDKFAKWAKTRDEARQQAARSRSPYGNAARPR